MWFKRPHMYRRSQSTNLCSQGRRHLSSRTLWLGIGVLGLLVVWLVDGGSLWQYVQMQRELHQLQREIESLEQTNARLREEIQRVQHDAFTLEQLARDRLGFVREGETVYQFVERP
ncbi:MAG: septum formation initiator family protein [Nitrospirae bacterium]|nr:MAG: septum formation initiator family protein [Nitrospirota bacterium]